MGTRVLPLVLTEDNKINLYGFDFDESLIKFIETIHDSIMKVVSINIIDYEIFHKMNEIFSTVQKTLKLNKSDPDFTYEVFDTFLNNINIITDITEKIENDIYPIINNNLVLIKIYRLFKSDIEILGPLIVDQLKQEIKVTKTQNYSALMYNSFFTFYYDTKTNSAPEKNFTFVPMDLIYFNMLHQYVSLLKSSLNTSSYITTQEELTKLSDKAFLSALVTGGGPILTKFLQRYGSVTRDKSFKKLINPVFEDLPACTKSEFDMVKSIILKKSTDLESIDEKPLNVASIGEVHFGYTDKRIKKVVKFIKPRTLLLFMIELALVGTEIWPFINNDVDIPKTLKEKSLNFTGFNLIQITNEFKYLEEKSNSEKASKIYKINNYLTIAAVTNASNLPLPFSVMDVAKGQSLSGLVRNDPTSLCDLEESIKKLVNLWFTNTILRNGFFHADLHPGNIFIDLKNKHKKITLIDFGDCSTLSVGQQCSLISLINLHAQMLKAKNEEKRKEPAINFIKISKRLCKIELNEEQFQKIVSYIINHYNLDVRDSFSELIAGLLETIDNGGNCTIGSISEFAKGLSHLEGLWAIVVKNCKGNRKSNLIELVSDAIYSSPSSLTSAINKSIHCLKKN